MSPLKDLSIRTKAFAASLVLLLCLIGIGGNAYLTSDRAATDLNELTATNLPKQQAVAKLETDVTAIHLKVFRYVSWASNSVSANLLRTLSDEARHDLRAMTDRIAALRRGPTSRRPSASWSRAWRSTGRNTRPPRATRSTSARATRRWPP